VPPADDDAPITRLLVIKALPLFADVEADELAIIAEHAQVRSFGSGETVFGGPEVPVDAIHLILEGRITEHRNGRPFRTYGPQRVLGGVDALARTGRAVHAVADEDTRTLAIERAALREILEDNFGILVAALQGVAAAILRLRTALPSAGFEGAGGDDDAPPFVDSLAARLTLLRENTWLGRAGVRTLGQLVREAEVTTVAGDTRLWTAGDGAEHALVVLRGAVACTPADRRAFRVGSGTILGLDEALALDARWCDAATTGDATLLALTRTALLDALEDDADSAVEVLAAMASVASGLRDLVAEGGST
jgi:CRP-like cAMP-binding protein